MSRSRLSLSRSLAVVAVVRVATIVMMSKSVIASIEKIWVSLGVSFRSRGSLCISRPLAIVAVVGVAIVSTIVSTIVSKSVSVSIVAVPGVSFSLGVSGRCWLCLSRSLAVVAVVRVATVVMMSKSVIASIKKIRVSLWIGNCLCFSFRLAHGKDGQAEKSQNPDHRADAEVGWKCLC